MNRSLTNAIRFVLDECLPPMIRDKKWFMKPMFKYWFKNHNVEQIMNFKALARHMDEKQFSSFYNGVEAQGSDRPTDMNQQTMKWFLGKLPDGPCTLLDIGCGRGFWLNMLAGHRPDIDLTGLDFFDTLSLERATYVKGNIEKLPFADKSFDIVTCSHTIEHLQDLPKAISELKRVARQKVLIVTPRQRYYYYTLDLHLHFFPQKYQLIDVMDMEIYDCINLRGDWGYCGYIN